MGRRRHALRWLPEPPPLLTAPQAQRAALRQAEARGAAAEAQLAEEKRERDAAHVRAGEQTAAAAAASAAAARLQRKLREESAARAQASPAPHRATAPLAI